MMEFLKIISFAIVALSLLTLLKQYNPAYAIVVGVSCSAILMLWVLQSFSPLLAVVQQFANYANWVELKCVLKASAIAVLTQMTQDLCRDAGHTALAGRIELAGRTAMLLAALPLFVSLSDILVALL